MERLTFPLRLVSGSSPTPAKEPVTAVTANSSAPSAAHLQTSDAIAAVAQLFQSSQGQQVRGSAAGRRFPLPDLPPNSSLPRQLQQMLQNFQQQPVKPESNCRPPVHVIQTHAGPNTAAPQPAPPAEPSQQKGAFDKVVKDAPDVPRASRP